MGDEVPSDKNNNWKIGDGPMEKAIKADNDLSVSFASKAEIDPAEDSRPRSRKTATRFLDVLRANEAEHETLMRQVQAMVTAASPIIARELPKMVLPSNFGQRLLEQVKSGSATPDQRAACEFYCSYYLKAVGNGA